nr:TIGR01457 family HAD-type hydrolase [Paenibacillus shirakamiensis]
MIDLDGTLYHGSHRIPGADELIHYLQSKNIPYLFVTNNSSRTPQGVADHLQEMGIPAEPEHVCTSSQAAAFYIASQRPNCRVAVIGEEGLTHALEQAGLKITEERPEYVVQGIDRHFNYDKLTHAVRWIMEGAGYILTNPDLLLPSEDGLTPGAGTIAASIQAAAGIKPIVIGKPSEILMNFALEKLSLPSENVAVIGDNIHTDILAGARAGCGTILTLTGITTHANLVVHSSAAGVQPDYIYKDLEALLQGIRNSDMEL